MTRCSIIYCCSYLKSFSNQPPCKIKQWLGCLEISFHRSPLHPLCGTALGTLFSYPSKSCYIIQFQISHIKSLLSLLTTKPQIIINTIMLEAIPKLRLSEQRTTLFFKEKTFYIISNLDWQNWNQVKRSTLHQNYICRGMKNYHQLQNHSRKLSNRNEKHQLGSILRQTHLLV